MTPTKCTGGHCPLKFRCQRFVQNLLGEIYFAKIPYDSVELTCDKYLPKIDKYFSDREFVGDDGGPECA